MGKRKQKVRWSSVDGISWSNGDQDESSTDVSSKSVKVEGSEGSRRSSAPSWTSSVAPRFERKAAEQKHIYYDGEICEAEDLPNGFTKIRSKNLDILFKRDYYEQRLAVQQQISEQLLKVKNSDMEENSGVPASENPELLTPEDSPKEEIVDNIQEPESVDKSCPWTFDKIDPNDIPEFKPSDTAMDAGELESGHTSPFYVNHLPQEYETPPQPNLYLYTPANNTLIPCEEIIIPNPGMSADGPVYPGPTNIYLAYPVQGPDGRGYITQPYTPTGSYMSQDSTGYQYEETNSYSSTPHTHHSGEDSGSSTQPTSPPALDSCDPTNWARNVHHTHPSPPNIEGYYDPLPSYQPVSASTAPPAEPKPTVPYIPGLVLDNPQPTQKKTQKRRKKKTNKLESPGDSSSDFEALKPSSSENIMYTQESGDGEYQMEAQVPGIKEIHLTDDLADSLVNPPIDSEVADENLILPCSSSSTNYPQIESLKEKSIEMDNYVENLKKAPSSEIEGTNQTELDDKEICDITSNIPEIKSWTNVTGSNFSSESHASKSSESECVQNIVESVDVSKESVTSYEGLENVVDEKASIESVTNIEESKIEQNQIKSRKQPRTNKNSKKAKKVNLISNPQLPKSEDDVFHLHESKMSYSSVTKSNILKEPIPILPIKSLPRIDPVPISKPLTENSPSEVVQSNVVDDSDKWEKIPLSVSKDENWEKTSKKRKNKNKKIKFEEAPLIKDIPQNAKENTPPKEVPSVLKEESLLDDEIEKCEEAENEKKKQRRRKKKQSSEDPEESAGRRIVICDEQIEIDNLRSIKRASEVLNPSLLGNVKSSGFGDFLVVSELGLGISRGCMNFGRLYQGKYIPPERTDGLLAECEEEETTPENENIQEENIEDLHSAVPTDIGLD